VTAGSEIDPDALEQMRARGGSWAAYRNQAMDSRGLGHRQFIKFGPGCTLLTPPERAPDTPTCGVGWKYVLEGVVNLETGAIEALSPGQVEKQ